MGDLSAGNQHGELEALRTADLTYREVGRTRGELPPGYRHLRRQVVVGNGQAGFDRAVQTLTTWEMHRRAGLSVTSSSDVAREGTVAILRLGLGGLAVKAPVRVVYGVNEARRRGFAYGSLPGHPETGEEAFVVELLEDGTVTFTITAFSRPHSLLAKMSGPLGRVVQRRITSRYLRAAGA